jgi:hypothetical protein
MTGSAGAFFVLSPPPSGAQQWGIPAAQVPVFLDYDHHGYLCCAAWFYWAPLAITGIPWAAAASWRTR